MKIVLAEKVSAATLEVFTAEPGWTIVTHDQIKNGLEAELSDADAVVVRSAVQVTDALMEHAPRLKVIGRAGVGVDNIDAEAATRRGIVVMNTPGANAVSVAELAVAFMLSLARQIPKANAALHQMKWEKKTLQGVELRAKTLGILGLGRIGLEVARRARPFGMDVIAFDPFVTAAVARENGIRLVAREELFREADYLTLHVGLTPETADTINAQTIATMKAGVRIINCARGELIDDAALVEALKAGKVAGAALDVFRVEPPREPKDLPYAGLDNVLLTPHIAGSTEEAQEAIGIQIASQVREYLKLGVVQNAVNMPSLSHEEYKEVAPYVDMARRLGRFLSHATPGTTDSIQLVYKGALADTKTALVRNAALEGLLGQDDQVNSINAAAVAQERGIRLHEEKQEAVLGASGSVLKLVVHTEAGTAEASGTVLHGTSPRLLSANGIDIEAPLAGTLLYVRNHDVPGVIGRLGTVLGDHRVNIANFALGRPRAGEGLLAMAVVQIDGTLAPEALAVLQAVPAITDVRVITLAG